MKQLFKTSLGFSVVLSSLATTVTAQTLEEVVVTAQKREQAITDVSIAMNFMKNAGFTGKSGRLLKWEFGPVHVFHFFLDSFLGDFFGGGRVYGTTFYSTASSEFFLFKFFVESKG